MTNNVTEFINIRFLKMEKINISCSLVFLR